MGGKSRKGGGVSRDFIKRLIAERGKSKKKKGKSRKDNVVKKQGFNLNK